MSETEVLPAPLDLKVFRVLLGLSLFLVFVFFHCFLSPVERRLSLRTVEGRWVTK